MGVTIHVNGKSNSLVHKGSMGIAKSTIPDVCKTPSPGGPVPIPYPVIVSLSSDLKKGTKTVKVDGKNPAAVKGSEFSRCTGDEPGTAGGVKSSTNMKEATWILYSFDVKLDGKNACRLTDKMMMNHGNAACLAGVRQEPVKGDGWDMECLLEILCKEDKDVVEKAQKLEVTKANVFFDDEVFRNGKWESASDEWGGSASGNKVVLSANTDCEGAAETVYHEVLHTDQPDSMSWFDKEMEAYTKTEEWTIKRGLPGRPSFRTPGPGGGLVPDTQAISNMLTADYPIGITNRSPDGMSVKENGVWRAAKEGDKFPGPQRLENVEKIDPKEFKCP
jgi:hypothetical protein